ncbi:uncharacterized protein LACBIDRAFT_330321 [Laccaria bicolor S238N-H82]|uniref:Predicted protein n=1 Tax=Laccaria bicolor (strain S238N-H82 / ATCC MYA-4686) TaxID=486041 RepID=B0DKX4_LACBS|nr:uncharacterized protein LACBIDRAFT_330321 [Laccaria bicolor S238N-H82]EDR04815.1 predicted protein [Laccaria bicolor S238N-H82]|eukprot:XP_001884639.1 predicted protein [Laccaria bicolor S238N-H82]
MFSPIEDEKVDFQQPTKSFLALNHPVESGTPFFVYASASSERSAASKGTLPIRPTNPNTLPPCQHHLIPHLTYVPPNTHHGTRTQKVYNVPQPTRFPLYGAPPAHSLSWGRDAI